MNMKHIDSHDLHIRHRMHKKVNEHITYTHHFFTLIPLNVKLPVTKLETQQTASNSVTDFNQSTDVFKCWHTHVYKYCI